ncbi:MAG: mannose-1-phosphate guanylyltransferase/mannose-6-phosphate isomerase, partial [Marinobacter sp.]|nr:mannose-1-phosphate guanylyltransferase/mannose-6-phosphate isomerase [Marinobacter sp.]
GSAQVTRDDETFLLSENESTYIPIGSVHRLFNPGRIPLELIEVQSGAYLGEDDIERLDDRYGRSTPQAEVQEESVPLMSERV